MTSTHPPVDAPAAGRPGSRAGNRTRAGADRLAGPAPVAALSVACAGLLWASYALAATQPDQRHARYALFWAALVPPVLYVGRAVLRAPGHRHAVALTAWLAALTFLPKLFRSPHGPAYFDELAHWRAAEALTTTGRLPGESIVDVLPSYPGLHVLTDAFARASGVGTWVAATVLLLVLHVLQVVGVARFARAVLDDERAGPVAGFGYALNPGFLFFTAQYAYESLALVLVIWTLAWAAELTRGEPAGRWPTLVVAGLATAATAVTHHLSSLVLVAFLAVLCLGAGRRREVVGLAGFAVGVNVVWVATQARHVLTYLAPYPREGAAELEAILAGRAARGESRQAFTGSELPGYELLAGTVTPVLVTLLALGGAALLLADRERRRRTWPVVLLAGLYPASLPLVLTATGQAGAHRSWPYSWVPLVVVVAAAVLALPERLAATAYPVRRVARPAAALTCAAVLLGSSAVENNDGLRFPGPFVGGSDTRLLTRESALLGGWLRAHTPPGQRFLADTFTAGVVEAHGGDVTARGFPSWDLLFYPGQPKPATLRRLGPERVELLVVDRRMSTQVYRGGYYVSDSEPLAGVRTAPVPPAALTKLDRFPWAAKLYASENFAVYALTPALVDHGELP